MTAAFALPFFVLPCSLARFHAEKADLTRPKLGSNLGSMLRSSLLPSFPQFRSRISALNGLGSKGATEQRHASGGVPAASGSVM